VTRGLEGWCTDPYNRHEARWMSVGKPTDLVRDGWAESRDPVAGEPFTVPPVPLTEETQMPSGFQRADDPRSWELPVPISEKAVARRRRKDLSRELGPFYWLPVDFFFRRMLAVVLAGGGLLVLKFFGWVGFVAYELAIAVPVTASRVWVRRRRAESSAEVLEGEAGAGGPVAGGLQVLLAEVLTESGRRHPHEVLIGGPSGGAVEPGTPVAEDPSV